MGISTKSHKTSRKEQVRELRQKHERLFDLEGLGDKAKFVPKMAYIPRAGAETVLQAQSRGKMFMYVAENSFNYSVLAEHGFTSLSRLIDICECYTFTYSKLHEAIDSPESLVAI